MSVIYRPLTLERLADVVCCPLGLKRRGNALCGDIEQVEVWRARMIGLGLRGLVAYADGEPRGFAEYMPAETSPLPIDASGAAVLMCYHWAGTEPEADEHLDQERRMIAAVLDQTSGAFAGLAALGGDHPTHFPIAGLDGLGFREVAREEHTALMWYPLGDRVCSPTFARTSHRPQDLSAEGRLAIEVGFSARCPYSVHHAALLERATTDHPAGDRIRWTSYRIDTQDDARTYRVSPWD